MTDIILTNNEALIEWDVFSVIDHIDFGTFQRNTMKNP